MNETKGLIPRNSRIGNGIAIHATRPQEEWTVDNFTTGPMDVYPLNTQK